MFPHSPPISATLVPQYPKLCRGWFALIVEVFFFKSNTLITYPLHKVVDMSQQSAVTVLTV